MEKELTSRDSNKNQEDDKDGRMKAFDSLEKKENEMKALVQEKKEMKTIIERLAGDCRELERTNKSLNEKVDRLMTQMGAAASDRNLQNELQKLKQEKETLLNRLKEEIDDLRKEKANMEKESASRDSNTNQKDDKCERLRELPNANVCEESVQVVSITGRAIVTAVIRRFYLGPLECDHVFKQESIFFRPVDASPRSQIPILSRHALCESIMLMPTSAKCSSPSASNTARGFVPQ
ncbi:hypothetical protein ScPMuIL_011529 [Solemya velum]